MINRKDFIKQLSAAAVLGSLPSIGLTEKSNINDNKMWACLLHLSFNFAAGIKDFGGLRKEFEPDKSVWDTALKKMADKGINTVVINLDDSIKWDSHPEIALRNSWSPTQLQNQLNKMRKMGLEPIPQLNFSTTHDAWLGPYARMVSSEKYYQVCRDLISEAIDLFGTPRFFHLGMDEESASYQSHSDYTVIRQNDLWWNDLHFLVGEVETHGTRAWVWSDYVWRHPDQFFNKMPKSVLQSNWYYGKNFDLTKMDEDTKTYVEAYIKLEKQGYDQIPTASFHANNEDCIFNSVKFCTEHISDDHLNGFLQTFWKPTIEKYQSRILKGIELTSSAKDWYINHH